MLLIKDNHIQAAGSVSLAIKLAKQKNKKRLPLEVETKNLREVRETLKAGVTFIMLDNFSLKNLKLAVKIIRDFEQKNVKKCIDIDRGASLSSQEKGRFFFCRKTCPRFKNKFQRVKTGQKRVGEMGVYD